ncbi:hypothetical protein [Gordonia liuliyuniae]|uniref:hypothetical protein n=1 Tax=Gordonia liuliyuniae TaxID=2911517 RepID=UPI0027E00AC6|nr:hypothetical protein [Gordonia liuliyuniae]
MAVTTRGARICPLCESTCGLLFTLNDGAVVDVEPNHDDVFSRGYCCGKGLGLAGVENDPDRDPREMACRCGVDTELIETVARGFAEAASAVAHSRIGTCMQIRNVARYSAPLRSLADDELAEWQILLRLAAAASGTPDVSTADWDDRVAQVATRRAAKLAGVDVERAAEAVSGRSGPLRLLDLRLRSGPYGDQFGLVDGLSLATLEQRPEGIDFGPLRPRIPEVLRTPNGRIDLVPAMLVDDIDRLRRRPGREGGLLMINRRQPRGMNSWLHTPNTSKPSPIRRSSTACASRSLAPAHIDIRTEHDTWPTS